MKKKPKKKKPERFETINLRVSISEKKKIQTQARKFAKGKLSRWLRIAGVEFEPRKTLELVGR